VYIDDVVVFSRLREEHLVHIDSVLTTLQKSGITLSASKCHFGYPSIELLGHHVSRFGITTSEDKIKAMVEKAFPENLKLLECGLGLFNYYRRFIEWYASVSAPLVELKKVGFRKSPVAGRARDNFAVKTTLTENEGMKALSEAARDDLMLKARAAWTGLQAKLAKAPRLAYADFHRPFILYTDGSLEHGLGAAVHQIQGGKEVPILFLSRCLQPNERHYWATELETLALVWALQKVPQYFNSGEFTVITDYVVLTGCLQNGQYG
jgi:RNase H-like domain found in reverse transcriptase/Reverse transcriptase (RNA-dependent DNA polymerase)